MSNRRDPDLSNEIPNLQRIAGKTIERIGQDDDGAGQIIVLNFSDGSIARISVGFTDQYARVFLMVDMFGEDPFSKR